MNPKNKNLRDLVITPDTGVNPWDSSVTNTLAKETPAERERNETREYRTGKPAGLSDPGGENSAT